MLKIFILLYIRKVKKFVLYNINNKTTGGKKSKTNIFMWFKIELNTRKNNKTNKMAL